MCKYAQVCATRLCIINCDKGEAKNLRRDVSMSEILTAKELADQLKVKPETVRRWARAGVFPFIKLSAKAIRFDNNAVRQALDGLAQKGQQR